MESLEETLTSLKNEKADAEENLALFEEVIGDGYFYTPSAGTIVMNAVREDSYLSGESLIIAYNNPEIVSVTASVDQSDIAGIGIGDSVYVAISGYGNYQGKVTMVESCYTGTEPLIRYLPSDSGSGRGCERAGLQSYRLCIFWNVG